MAISLDGLDGAFRGKVEQLLATLTALGVDMRPYDGIRTPEEQAIFWRQSRSKEEIALAIQKLKSANAKYLVSVLEGVGPRHGPPVTNALPGFSWHQWGEALDCFWSINGAAEWSTTRVENGVNGYRIYAAKAKEIGLNPGGLWSSLKDWPHVQLNAFASPVSAGMTVAEIDAAMKQRFG